MRSASAETIAELADPQLGTVAARVSVGVGALATSSVAKRRWQVGSGYAHHIIDPRTGAPAASPIVAASVTAATAVAAEAAAKCVLLMGTRGLAWADQQDWIRGAVAFWDTGAVFATRSVELAA